jgi:lipoprotein-anchoring transpeptidase ErfK/SrfK
VRAVACTICAAVLGLLGLAGCGSDVRPDDPNGAEVTPTTSAATSPTTTAATTPTATSARTDPLGARLERRVALRASPGGKVLASIGTRTRWGSPRVLAVVGRRNGWLAVLSERRLDGRAGWIPASAAQLLREPYAIRIDLSKRQVTVRHDGDVVRRFTVAVGAPGSPTPTGRFAVTDTLKLVGAGPYGCCAIALTARQPEIPQGWTGGDRIAIHGTSEPGSIGQAVSHGCLRAQEADLRWLLRHIPLGSPVRITA